MTTFVRSRRHDNVLIGFAVLVLAAIAVRVAIAGAAAGVVVAGLLALAVVGAGVWLNRRPSRELRVSPAEIVYVANGRVTLPVVTACANPPRADCRPAGRVGQGEDEPGSGPRRTAVAVAAGVGRGDDP